jgi:hypothetical protein
VSKVIQKGQLQFHFTKLYFIDNDRIYLGSNIDLSRILFWTKKKKKTLAGINTIGNGQWWQTFVHVFDQSKRWFSFCQRKRKFN